MLKITLIVTGKLKERFWKDACTEYQKRLGAYVHLVIKELPDSTREQEASAQLARIDSIHDAHIILLDIHGKELSSEELADRIDTLTINGVSHIVFVIGGSDGVTDEIKKRVDERISFGRITLPHNLARVILLEQIYRSQKIIRHEPYHK